ncbi:16S rRNA (cytidine(1402)-2'-O)-methyltransferase [Capnocytophaga genosp. AHN8471]|uniref:Ribosomal RNA small subunit methyltransferase I n=1 Tax=Capnocytophaga genosp. AHN8471 TaxID=327574 RepID=A0ABS1YV76_9FLAO|nr:16S rRNA (cytidine(1402)-2'-O)-methyltransferase [Capnocytophaga genosp. AHN8471]MBM0649968.1 16S rRNA (cytidine(1402)-2'-O)-methyltransferase [Capnocytophaga genosp. AHN8471]MBM0660805.1 16S rRNA (cytidine(1402)-2'-O)-methyltransferase [Capnocytophaga genosp. AHN8471]
MSKLYLIPTPIGNLEDITLRALNLLKEVDIILAEDTRTSSKLLKHYNIHTPMQSYHLFNEHKVVDSWVQRIKGGTTVALITDAGTPAISDPGFLLSRACIAEGVDVECLPGATAFVPALVNSGLPNDRFVFEGFLPDKKGRQTRLSQLATETKTMIFYVSPHKLLKTLTDFIATFGANRPASLSRELTKVHEETKRGTLQELLDFYKDKNVKGEIVMIVSGNK